MNHVGQSIDSEQQTSCDSNRDNFSTEFLCFTKLVDWSAGKVTYMNVWKLHLIYELKIYRLFEEFRGIWSVK